MEMKESEILGRICRFRKLTEYRAPKCKKEGTKWKTERSISFDHNIYFFQTEHKNEGQVANATARCFFFSIH